MSHFSVPGGTQKCLYRGFTQYSTGKAFMLSGVSHRWHAAVSSDQQSVMMITFTELGGIDTTVNYRDCALSEVPVKGSHLLLHAHQFDNKLMCM